MDEKLLALAEHLRKRNYQVSLFETREGAADYLVDQFHGTRVGIGDSETLRELCLYERLQQTDNEVVDPKRVETNEEFLAKSRVCLTMDYFLCSCNAITEDGIIINMDSTGNRVAGSLFGHKKMFYVLGKNKIMPDVESAVYKIRHITAPANAKRLGRDTPCAAEGTTCYDCDSPDRICNALVIQIRKMKNMDEEVVLINEELGL